jgi:hypothetical protein
LKQLNYKFGKSAAVEFFFSDRGQYIVAQALHVAIKILELDESHRREGSNIADMKYLTENVFTFPIAQMEQAEKSLLKKLVPQKSKR